LPPYFPSRPTFWKPGSKPLKTSKTGIDGKNVPLQDK
jgi:hypothetical protein